MHIEFSLENLKERHYLEDLATGGMKISKQNMKVRVLTKNIQICCTLVNIVIYCWITSWSLDQLCYCGFLSKGSALRS